MSKLYALAGRPGSGKTEYLKFIKANTDDRFQIVSALDYNTHSDLMKALYDLAQDDTCQCIAIDDYEVKLIESWHGTVNDAEYVKCLSILAGFSDNFDIAIAIVVGLKRDADNDATGYFNKANLRAPAIEEEVADVFFIKYGVIDLLKTSNIRSPWGQAAALASSEKAENISSENGDWFKYISIAKTGYPLCAAEMEGCFLFNSQITDLLSTIGRMSDEETKQAFAAMRNKNISAIENIRDKFVTNAAAYEYDSEKANIIFDYMMHYSPYTEDEEYWLKFATFSGMYAKREVEEDEPDTSNSALSNLDFANDYMYSVLECAEALVELNPEDENFADYFKKVKNLCQETQELLNSMQQEKLQ